MTALLSAVAEFCSPFSTAISATVCLLRSRNIDGKLLVAAIYGCHSPRDRDFYLRENQLQAL